MFDMQVGGVNLGLALQYLIFTKYVISDGISNKNFRATMSKIGGRHRMAN